MKTYILPFLREQYADNPRARSKPSIDNDGVYARLNSNRYLSLLISRRMNHRYAAITSTYPLRKHWHLLLSTNPSVQLPTTWISSSRSMQIIASHYPLPQNRECVTRSWVFVSHESSLRSPCSDPCPINLASNVNVNITRWRSIVTER